MKKLFYLSVLLFFGFCAKESDAVQKPSYFLGGKWKLDDMLLKVGGRTIANLGDIASIFAKEKKADEKLILACLKSTLEFTKDKYKQSHLSSCVDSLKIFKDAEVSGSYTFKSDTLTFDRDLNAFAPSDSVSLKRYFVLPDKDTLNLESKALVNGEQMMSLSLIL